MIDLLSLIADIWNKIFHIMNSVYLIDTPSYKLSLLGFNIAIFIVGLVCTVVFNVVRHSNKNTAKVEKSKKED